MIVPFRSEVAGAFHDLNIAWIERLFRVEPADLKMLEDPQDAIIDHGGEIFFMHRRTAPHWHAIDSAFPNGYGPVASATALMIPMVF